MSLLFTAPVTSQGVTFVNVDELGDKKLGESGNSPIAKDIYENQAIMAIYDGKQFAKQKFSSIHRTPIVVEEVPQEIEQEVEQEVVPQEVEPQEVVQEEVVQEEAPQEIVAPEPIPEPIPEPVPVDIWAPDYAGDPDDPANTTSPDALDSKGVRIFANTITIGNQGAMYTTIKEAITGLINDYGESGGGHKIAIEIDSEYTPPRNQFEITGKSIMSDLSWITIFAQQDATLNFDNIHINLRSMLRSPIFNFKMSYNGLGSFFICNMGESPNKPISILTFGRNTFIKAHSLPAKNHQGKFFIRSDGSTLCYPVLSFSGNYRVEAKYGIVVVTNTGFITLNCLINKGDFTYTGNQKDYLFRLHGDENIKMSYTFPKNEIYNTTITTELTHPDTGIFLLLAAKAYLRNVTSIDRTGKIKGLSINKGIATLENCKFASNTVGTPNAGYDIFVGYIPNIGAELYSYAIREIHLKNTTGNTNQPVNEKTELGIIYRE